MISITSEEQNKDMGTSSGTAATVGLALDDC